MRTVFESAGQDNLFVLASMLVFCFMVYVLAMCVGIVCNDACCLGSNTCWTILSL